MSTAPFPPGLAASFEPVRLIGAGGFGAVWQARQKALDRMVAVKLLHAEHADSEELVRRFHDEAKLTASIVHPSVVTLLAYGVDGETPWMAFEYVEGQSLRSWAERGPSPWRMVAEAGRQVALALGEARKLGVVHRDVKPDNILECEPGRYKVADFGIAKWIGASVKTRTGVILGTPAYISPLQVRGLGPDHQSDLYALGVTLFELLTGKLPFFDENPVVLLEHHLSSTAPRVRSLAPDVPPVLDAIVDRLLSKTREGRPLIGEELAAELSQLLSDTPDEKRSTRLVESRGRSRPSVAPTGVMSRAAAGPAAAGAAGAFTAPARSALGRRAAWMAAAGVAAVCLYVFGRTGRQQVVVTSQPSPGRSVSVVESPVAVRSPANPAECEAIVTAAHNLAREAAIVANQAPKEGDPTGGSHEDIGPVVEQAVRLVERYADLVRRAGAVEGPAESLLFMDYVGTEILEMGQRCTVTASLKSLLNSAPPGWERLPASIAELSRVLAGPFRSPEMRILGRSLRRQAEHVSAPPYFRPPALIGDRAAQAAKDLEELASREHRPNGLHLVLARVQLLDRAVEVSRNARRTDYFGSGDAVVRCTPAERALRLKLLEMGPSVITVELTDGRFSGLLFLARWRVAANCLMLAEDIELERPRRASALKAVVELSQVLVSGEGWIMDIGREDRLVRIRKLGLELDVPIDPGWFEAVRKAMAGQGAAKE